MNTGKFLRATVSALVFAPAERLMRLVTPAVQPSRKERRVLEKETERAEAKTTRKTLTAEDVYAAARLSKSGVPDSVTTALLLSKARDQ